VAKTTRKKSPPAKAAKPQRKSPAARQSKPAVKATAKPGTKVLAKSATRSGNGSAKAPAKAPFLARANHAPSSPVVPAGNLKPIKNQAGLSKKELEGFQHLLVDKRRELIGDVASMEEEALRTGGSNLSNLPIHMADMGSDNYEQEFTLRLVDKDRQLLREITHALRKIADGSYGICEGTGKPISKARLEVKPWARHSIEYTRQMESGLLRR
jgi:DnaK suppressor protein